MGFVQISTMGYPIVSKDYSNCFMKTCAKRKADFFMYPETTAVFWARDHIDQDGRSEEDRSGHAGVNLAVLLDPWGRQANYGNQHDKLSFHLCHNRAHFYPELKQESDNKQIQQV